jgi:hypothetical protein
MTNDKDAAPGVRTTRESEIFRDPQAAAITVAASELRRALNYLAAVIE